MMIFFLLFLRNHAKNSKLCRYLEKKIAKIDGGYTYSPVIRKLYEEKYGLKIGYGSYGGCWNNSVLWWSNIEIGNYCSFATDFAAFTYNHPMNIFTTHPITYATWMGATESRYLTSSGSLIIGHGVWVGSHAIIMPSCHSIGDGAIIAGGSVVTHNVPPYAVVVGNPAKVLRYRLTQEQIKKVNASNWWLMDKDHINDQMDNLLKLTKI